MIVIYLQKTQTLVVNTIVLMIMKGDVVVVIVWLLDLQLSVQSVHITTEVVSSNPVHGEMYLIQH